MKRRTATAVSTLVALFAGLLVSTAGAQAQSFPSRPIQLVTGNPPGGATDVIARTLGMPLGTRLGQNVIIDNRPGANGNISAEIVAKATARRPHHPLRQQQPGGGQPAHLPRLEPEAAGRPCAGGDHSQQPARAGDQSEGRSRRTTSRHSWTTPRSRRRACSMPRSATAASTISRWRCSSRWPAST